MNNLYFKELEEYATKNNIPIITKDGLEVLIKYVKKIKPQNVLEIGTAIGYSALKIQEICNSNIETFERDKNLAILAKTNITKFNKDEYIQVIEADFLQYDLEDKKYDFIYVDGAKAQYYNFFKHFESNMHDDTVVLFDNLNFHDYVYNEKKKENASKNLKQLIRKLEKFLEKIKEEKNYKFQYINKGDGIGILTKDGYE